tara:strand:+ start:2241 stop:2426 length:186 start_codon:yes stop_codon:yes gene_type:complete
MRIWAEKASIDALWIKKFPVFRSKLFLKSVNILSDFPYVDKLYPTALGRTNLLRFVSELRS